MAFPNPLSLSILRSYEIFLPSAIIFILCPIRYIAFGHCQQLANFILQNSNMTVPVLGGWHLTPASSI